MLQATERPDGQGVVTFDVAAHGLRALNQALHDMRGKQTNETVWEVVNTRGAHAIAAGVDAPLDITVHGTTGYYCAGMNKQATIRIKGNASSRCGISMKGIDIVVHGSIGHMSAFMAQSGNLVVLGDAGEALGDSLYEARLFVRGAVKSLGADCVEKEMRSEHLALLEDLLRRGLAEGKARPEQFRRYGSARRLYTFHVDNAASY